MRARLPRGKGLNERMVLRVDRASKTTFVRAVKERGMTVSALMRERMVGVASGEATAPTLPPPLQDHAGRPPQR